ncbi:FxsA family protein [Oceanobacillus alkalisoli]|uniref:FxsA family protein n=1 Tax=Oceanobacillus alkalisoli TaxID=2925113 RepID=UPI001F11957A|nr:FxsA family protein [Oceanobacillus alkalisoli]MCF3943358.1 FxsA family protein [Oceanobacillus alkalisoli]
MRMFLIGLLIFSLLEIGLLVWAGSHIGVWWVLFLIVFTAFLGLIFGRIQGFGTWNRVLRSMERQEVPTAEVTDGLCILIGAFLLITPGFISDCIGLILLLPFTRNLLKRYIARLLHRFVQKGTIIYRRF